MDTKQFYPTPRSLATRMHQKFERSIGHNSVVLEPQAGRGDLLQPLLRERGYDSSYYNAKTVDACEIDQDNAAILRDKKINVVGHNFLDFTSGKHYTHIISNPPFREGAAHAIKAWDILYDGELVVLLNAETIKNPHTKERQHLAQIIADNNGTVEYIQEGFTDADTFRRTEVECAIVHIVKVRAVRADYAFLDGLHADIENTSDDIADAKPVSGQLIIPGNTIKEAVLCFNSAKRALIQEIEVCNQMLAQTQYYTSKLAESIIEPVEGAQPATDTKFKAQSASDEFNKRLDSLKDRAWSTVFTATDVGKKLSSSVLEDIKQRFEEVKQLQFTEQNIHGFLMGLVMQQGDMQINMLCDVHDEFTKYHPENRIYFRGWKSNAKHRDPAYEVKTTRIIMPFQMSGGRGRHYIYSSCRAMMQLRDIDKAFRHLDGKPALKADGDTSMGMADYIAANCKDMDSQRVSTEYFDIRYYDGVGTLHIFPKRKDLMSRLNRWVGRHRQWMPHSDDKSENPQFWAQHAKAEQITKIVNDNAMIKRIHNYDLMHSEDNTKRQEFQAVIESAGESLGLDMQYDRLPANDDGIPKLTNVA